jgi:hypothetical protein
MSKVQSGRWSDPYRAATPDKGSVRRARSFRSGKRALLALANASQILPRVNPAGVAISPVELDGVSTHGMCARRFRRRRVHRQQHGWREFGLAGFAALLSALVHARSAGAGVAQPCKAPRAFVAVGPVDLQALALGHQHAHFFRRDRGSWESDVRLIVSRLFLFRGEADALVAHRYSLQFRVGSLQRGPIDARFDQRLRGAMNYELRTMKHQ